MSNINQDKYFISLYSKYIELNSKGINCEIYFSSPVGYSFLTKEELLMNFNKNDNTSFLLADDKGQCIYNQEIFIDSKNSKIDNILSYDDFTKKLTRKHSEDILRENYGKYLENKIAELNKDNTILNFSENDNLKQMNL